MPKELPKLYVILAADTEDNQPSYVPGWWRYGSDYDSNPLKLRFDWLRYLDLLWNCFDIDDIRFKVTWFLRTDPTVGDRCLNALSDLIDRAQEARDELAIHIHTLRLDERMRWIQCLNQDTCRSTISESINIFKTSMGTFPKSARMGWNYMSNSIMQQLENNGVSYDASCIPGIRSQLMYGQRDNFYDWSKSPCRPFHPSYDDYQVPGTMKILEIPVSTYENVDRNERNVFPNWLRTASGLRRLTSVGATASEFPLISTARRFMFRNDFLIFSPWRNSADVSLLLSSKLSESLLNCWSYVLGYFHPSELLNPLSGKPNLAYLRNLRFALSKIVELQNIIEVVPITLFDFGHAFQEDMLREGEHGTL